VGLNGQTVSGNIYLFTSPEAGTAQVRFYLDDPGMSGPPRRTEFTAPYDLAGGPVEAADPFDTRTLSNGQHTITAAIEQTTAGTSVVSASFTVANPTGTRRLELENLDGVPFPDRLVFSRIGSLTSPPPNGVHDRATLRIKNVGSDSVRLDTVTVSGPWVITPPTSLPVMIPAGSHLDIQVRFTATGGGLHTGALTMTSNADQPTLVSQLAGWWQDVPEGDNEPGVSQIVQLLGYLTTIVGPGQTLNQHGLVQKVGDEVLSPYWQRADTSKPVTVRQIAAYHGTAPGSDSSQIFWHGKGSTALNNILTHAGIDAQTMLPRIAGSTSLPAEAAFTPNVSTFGFVVDSTEWSDPTRNNQLADMTNGCPGPCGHHVRFWPVRDRQGVIVPNTWLLFMDYAGINYDYNDNVYLISNIKPEN
jgi:hypothetical protein